MVGLSRKTLYAHIKQGKVSAQSDSDGEKVIDQAELLRVYGLQLKTPVDSEKDTDTDTVTDQVKSADAELEKYKQHVRALVASNKSLREQNAMLKQLVVDAREREKHFNARYEKTLLIFERLLPRRGKQET